MAGYRLIALAIVFLSGAGLLAVAAFARNAEYERILFFVGAFTMFVSGLFILLDIFLTHKKDD